MRIHVYSPNRIEPWDYRNVFEKGIGGSETSHVELAIRLAKRGHQVTSYTDLPADQYDHVAHGVRWCDLTCADFSRGDLWIVYRSPSTGAQLLRGTRAWLVCQDVFYPDWKSEDVAKFEKVIGLCPRHLADIAQRDPANADKLVLSGNGVNVERLIAAEREGIERDHARLIWASSPDRGLKELLDIFERAKEQVPELTLDVFYGMDNIDKICGGDRTKYPWRESWKQYDRANTMDGVTWRGRIGQEQLTREYLASGIWVYPTWFCVTGDTLVDMPRDYVKYPSGVPISELSGKSGFPVWTYDETCGEFKLSRTKWVAKTREKAEVWKVLWDDGTALRATPDHLVLTYKRGWVQVRDLRPGESAVALKKHASVEVSVGRGRWQSEHREIARWKFGSIPKGWHVDHIDGNSLNNDPSNLQLLSPQAHAVKTFTGVPAKRQAVAKRVSGWRTYWAQLSDEEKSTRGAARSKQFWQTLSADDREKFVRSRAEKVKVGQQKYLAALSDEERHGLGAAGREARWNHKVVSVEPCGVEDVYDMEIADGPHNFVADGVVVHNCETSCISCMEAQALGAIPITNPIWATGYNVKHGFFVEGLPADRLVLTRYVDAVVRVATNPGAQDAMRVPMMKEARERLSWERVADQWHEMAEVQSVALAMATA